MEISPKVQNVRDTNHMKLNKKESPSVNTSVTLRRGNKIIVGDRGRKLDGKGRGRRRGGAGSRIERDRRVAQRTRRTN